MFWRKNRQRQASHKIAPVQPYDILRSYFSDMVLECNALQLSSLLFNSTHNIAFKARKHLQK